MENKILWCYLQDMRQWRQLLTLCKPQSLQLRLVQYCRFVVVLSDLGFQAMTDTVEMNHYPKLNRLEHYLIRLDLAN